MPSSFPLPRSRVSQAGDESPSVASDLTVLAGFDHERRHWRRRRADVDVATLRGVVRASSIATPSHPSFSAAAARTAARVLADATGEHEHVEPAERGAIAAISRPSRWT